jgi:Tol biopolymer transport system component
MRILLPALLLLCTSIPAGAGGGASASDSEPDGDRFISRARRLTFEGKRAGEGYFSPDGSKMVFQSERAAGNPFYQLYELDLGSVDTRRVSNGVGKVTCAFYRPGSEEILFASTHHDPRSLELQQAEFDLRASGEERRYAWDFDPEMDIYVTEKPGEWRRVTEARGYDAEGSYSPNGKWIVFSSTRGAFDHELSDDERKQLETDPPYFADLYLMRADGSDQRRLTTEPGYDGGPFFMPDGKRIVWRHFDTQGLIADVWTMALDGSDKRQVTDFGSMSWAPYPHPSGEYIFFTSNKHGFENFELFIVDSAGEKAPVRVTHTSGFDGLPVPLPDGAQLSWTTTRSGKGAQIHIARWDHEAARRSLAEAPLRGATERGDD